VPPPLHPDAEPREDAGRAALLLADEAEPEVRRADAAVVEPAGLLHGARDDPLGSRRQAHVPGDGPRAALDVGQVGAGDAEAPGHLAAERDEAAAKGGARIPA
jgi:hypothetical protein